MPKKTKRSKLAAAQRKKEILLKTFLPSNPKRPTTPIEPDKRLSGQDLTLKNYFTHDLKKSLLIIACIIALEIAIYFGTMNTYLGRISGF